MEKTDKSEREWLATSLLCFFLGSLGFHRFYVGKIGTGLLQFFTLVGCLILWTFATMIGLASMYVFFAFIGVIWGIWLFIDFIMILCQKFRDKEGRIIKS